MQYNRNHCQLATFAHKVLNTLATTELAVHADYLRFTLGEVESLAGLAEPQFNLELQRLVDGGFVIERKKSTVYQISDKGMRMKRIMNKLRDS